MRLSKSAWAGFLLFLLHAPHGEAQTATICATRNLVQQSSQGFSAAGKAALSRQLSGAVARGDTPGVVALVVGREGTLYEGAAGKLDIAHDVKMPANAIFNIMSMTKPVTSVAIMILFEEGKLKLDDPVSKYLPGFDNPQVLTKFNEQDGTYESRPAKRPITIRHLLTHTSGICYRFSNPIEARLTRATKKNAWELPLLSDPGDKWNYGPGALVLGTIIEKITGASLEAYYQQRIFQPLGMVDTSYAVPTAKQSRVPIVYGRVNGHLQAQPPSLIPSTPTPPFYGDGGLYSTAQDYGKFVQMLLNGGHLGSARILSESSVKMMGENNIGSIFVEVQPSTNEALARPFPLGAGRDKFGLGFQIASGDPKYARFRSCGSMSWAGMFNTEFWIDPVKHIGAVQIMQLLPFYDDGAIRTLRDFEELVYQNLRYEHVQSPTPSAQTSHALPSDNASSSSNPSCSATTVAQALGRD
jgi:methyl acetate hydrolase